MDTGVVLQKLSRPIVLLTSLKNFKGHPVLMMDSLGLVSSFLNGRRSDSYEDFVLLIHSFPLSLLVSSALGLPVNVTFAFLRIVY